MIITGCLSGGTSDGKVATWKRRAGNTDESIEGDWKLQEAVEIGSQVSWTISISERIAPFL